MAGQLTRNWWVPVLRGALGILFGATPTQLTYGAAALLAGAILFAIARLTVASDAS